uniref:Myosin phosphatase Rho interacting protein n=1 Tax=Saimiri boliviensis boliviensis TaxID=39432 RepID=A0A2K6UJZ4_SAIBB
MSAAKENPCRKFQANIFNKSKCQNCFKPRESHLLNDEDLTQQNTQLLQMKRGAHIYDATFSC